MGYVTSFSVVVAKTGKLKTEAEAIERIKAELDRVGAMDYALDENLDTNSRVKWYSHQDDMLDCTRVVGNDVVYILEGHGEDEEDDWREYYKNGKLVAQVGKVWEEVDLEKL